MELVHKLESWFRHETISQQNVQITGQVFNHAGFPDGTVITTSYLIARFTNLVATASGSRYYIGKPHESVVPEGTDPFAFRDQFLDQCGLMQCETADQFNFAIERAVRSTSPGMKQTQRPMPRIQLQAGLIRS